MWFAGRPINSPLSRVGPFRRWEIRVNDSVKGQSTSQGDRRFRTLCSGNADRRFALIARRHLRSLTTRCYVTNVTYGHRHTTWKHTSVEMMPPPPRGQRGEVLPYPACTLSLELWRRAHQSPNFWSLLAIPREPQSLYCMEFRPSRTIVETTYFGPREPRHRSACPGHSGSNPGAWKSSVVT